MAIPVLVAGVFGTIGLHATHLMFAQTLPSPTIVLTVPKTEYAVGDTVIATISNVSNINAYVANNCPREPLEVSKLSGSTWTPVTTSVGASSCANEPHDYEIPADRSIGVSYAPWQSTFNQPGTYRIQAAVELSSQVPAVEFIVK